MSASSAIRWCALTEEQGNVAPRRKGDRLSRRIEAHAGRSSLWWRSPDITLAELRARLRSAGFMAGIATLWRFFSGGDHAQKKSAHAAEQDRPDIVRRRQAGSTANSTSTPVDSSSSTRPGRRPTWPVAMAAHRAASG